MTPLDALIEAARSAANSAEIADAEQAFYKALLEVTVYVRMFLSNPHRRIASASYSSTGPTLGKPCCRFSVVKIKPKWPPQATWRSLPWLGVGSLS